MPRWQNGKHLRLKNLWSQDLSEIKYNLVMPRWRNGIRSGLKNLWSQGREGSIPSLGTIRIYVPCGRIFFCHKWGSKAGGVADNEAGHEELLANSY